MNYNSKPRKTVERFDNQCWMVERAIWHEAGISQAQLTLMFGYSHQVMVRILRRLIADGGVIRTVGPDKRANYYMQGN